MNYNFQPAVPGNFNRIPILISGDESLQYSNVEYLVIDDCDDVFEIRYEYHVSPFKEAILSQNIIAVGHEENFYLYDIVTKNQLINLMLDGYFGHLYMKEDLFYVADANGLHCIKKDGNVLWANNLLGIDGVFINEFTSDQILGEADIDPPGGWRDFTLDRKTGTTLRMS